MIATETKDVYASRYAELPPSENEKNV
jgi:hypothetical protein